MNNRTATQFDKPILMMAPNKTVDANIFSMKSDIFPMPPSILPKYI